MGLYIDLKKVALIKKINPNLISVARIFKMAPSKVKITYKNKKYTKILKTKQFGCKKSHDLFKSPRSKVKNPTKPHKNPIFCTAPLIYTQDQRFVLSDRFSEIVLNAHFESHIVTTLTQNRRLVF